MRSSLLCPQKQCLSGKEDGLSGLTNKGFLREGAPDEVGGGRARCDIISTNPKSRRLLPSRYAANPQSSFHSLRGTPTACHLPPRERLSYRPTVHLKGVTHYTLRGKACEKRTENFHVLCPFAVGANCVRPRAFTERPYEDDFLSAGKTCFTAGTLSAVFFYS